MPPPEIHVHGVVQLTERGRRRVPRTESGQTFVVHWYPNGDGLIWVRDYRAPSIDKSLPYQIWPLRPGEWETA